MQDAAAALRLEAALKALENAQQLVQVARELQSEAVERRLVAEHDRLAGNPRARE